MSIDIKVSVGDNKLLAQASLQQSASRQAQLEKEASKRLETQATNVRTTTLATQGRDAGGNPLIGTRSRNPQLERRPAASRTGGDSYIFHFPTEPQFLLTDGEVPHLYALGPVLKNKKVIPGIEPELACFNIFTLDTQQSFYLPTGGPYQEAAVGYKNFQFDGFPQDTALYWRSFNPVPLAPAFNRSFTAEWDVRVIEANEQAYNVAVSFGTNNQDILVSPDYISIQFSYSSEFNPTVPDQVRVYVNLSPSIFIENRIYNLPNGTIFPNRSSSSNTWQRTAITLSPNGYTIFIDGTPIITDTFATTVAFVRYTQFRMFSNFNADNNALTTGPALVCAFKLSPKVLYTGPYTPRSLLL